MKRHIQIGFIRLEPKLLESANISRGSAKIPICGDANRDSLSIE
jgi:hypothetical protein